MARHRINIHKQTDKQTDTIAVLLATVGLAQVRLISLWRSLSAAALLLESLLLTCTSTINLPLLLVIGGTMPHVARLLFGNQRVWQCYTYDRSCVSLLSNHQNFLTLNASSPRQAHEISVQLLRHIMGQQLPTQRLSTVPICPFASSVATINI